MHVLSLEVSTSSAKCILYSREEGVVLARSRQYPKEASDGLTQDPGGILVSAYEVLGQVARESSARGINPAAVGLCGTWHSMLLLDRDLLPIGRIRTWADLTGAKAAAAARAGGEAADYYSRTGCVLHGMYPCWKLAGMTAEDKGLSGASYIITQLEWLYLSLAGERAVSTCLASGSGLLNVHTLDWDEKALAAAGAGRNMLSPLRDLMYHGRLTRKASALTGLPEGLPVFIGGADGAMNQLAVGGTDPGVMSMSVGTSGAMRRITKVPKVAAKPSTWCYNVSEDAWIAGAATNNATNCVDWFIANVWMTPGDPGAYDELGKAAFGKDRSKAPVFLPFIFGERCPGWQEERAGGFFGIGPKHDRGSLYYSVLEGILFNMYQCYGILEGLTGPPSRIVVSGGITRSAEWMQLAADIFGLKLETTGSANDSTVGAALVAISGLEGESAVELPEEEPSAVYEPVAKNREALMERYGKYLGMYASTAP